MRYFKSKCFPVLACPWENKAGYESQSSLVREAGLDGMLCTTWHHLYGSGMMQIYFRAAHATWGTAPTGGYESLIFAQHLRQIGWDIPVKTYVDTGMFKTQLPKETAAPRSSHTSSHDYTESIPLVGQYIWSNTTTRLLV